MENEWTDPSRPKNLPKGPWVNEPDGVRFTSKVGYPCVLRRGGTKVWCGYVGIPETHPLHGKAYQDCDVEAHGGLTYSAPCQHGPSKFPICHTPAPGEPDNVWWLGFDCSHAGDALPFWDGGMDTVMASFYGDGSGDVYRTVEYVRAETEALAARLFAMAN